MSAHFDKNQAGDRAMAEVGLQQADGYIIVYQYISLPCRVIFTPQK